MREHRYFVYMLASQRNGTLYVGVTNNLIRRTWEHKNHLVEGFTKKYGVHRSPSPRDSGESLGRG